MKQDTTQNDSVVGSDAGQRMGSFAEAAGKILAISYPVLAISTGARAVYQLFLKEGVTDRLPPALTAVATRCRRRERPQCASHGPACDTRTTRRRRADPEG